MRSSILLTLLAIAFLLTWPLLQAGAAPRSASQPTSRPKMWSMGACIPPRPPEKAISPAKAVVLGVVEGITEYLPVSSTGHMILTSYFLGLDDRHLSEDQKKAVDAFEVIIQIGAVLAVLGLYRRRVGKMFRGLVGKDPAGLRMAMLLLTAFLPAVAVGLPLEKWIKAHLFAPVPVICAFAVGGVVMILIEKWRKGATGRKIASIESMTFRMALLIGFAQCLAMWPGTSRSMVTILAGVLVGLDIASAAEFSFLLALPTLSAASVHQAIKYRDVLGQSAGPLGMILGLAVSAVVAAVAVKTFVAYLQRRGLEPFGYYRLLVAAVFVLLMLTGQLTTF